MVYLRAILAAFYGVAGIAHLVAADAFLLIVPGFVPFPRETVLLTGVCEIFGAAGLLSPRFRRWAGIGLAVYAVAVFPANIKHALHMIPIDGLPESWWYHAPRLAFQPVLVWWALHAGGVLRRPW